MKQNKPRTFASKHADATLDPTIADEIKHHVNHNKITCAMAHKIAQQLDQSPAKIGEQLDLMECRLSSCQMGLFGHKAKNKMFNPDIEISLELNDTINNSAKEGRISCRLCWQIAKELNISRMAMGSACEKKGIRIKPCQLGAF